MCVSACVYTTTALSLASKRFIFLGEMRGEEGRAEGIARLGTVKMWDTKFALSSLHEGTVGNYFQEYNRKPAMSVSQSKSDMKTILHAKLSFPGNKSERNIEHEIFRRDLLRELWN